jgi:hypothetical protein
MGKGSKSQGDLEGKRFGMIDDYTSYGVISVGIIPVGYGMRYNKALRTGLGVTRDGGDGLTLSAGLDPFKGSLVVGAIVHL